VVCLVFARTTSLRANEQQGLALQGYSSRGAFLPHDGQVTPVLLRERLEENRRRSGIETCAQRVAGDSGPHRFSPGFESQCLRRGNSDSLVL